MSFPAADRVRVVVMIDSIGGPGGGETLAMEGAIGLDPERFETTLCVTRWKDAFEVEEPSRTWLRRLRKSGVRVVGLERSSRYSVWAWLPLVRILRGEGIQVLHAHLFGSNVWACILGRLSRVPVIIAHEHMWAYSGSSVRTLADRFLIAPLSTVFIAVSRYGRRQMIELERIPEDDIFYLPNGAPSLGPGDGAKIRDELGIGAEQKVVGSVGHLRGEKAFEVLVEAVGLLSRDHPELQVVIVGEGPERPMLEALRSNLGLDDRARLVGARSDIADLLASFDLAVCCSDFEGGPLSVIEYMEAGLPVVASRVGGLPEMVEDGVSGILVEPRDPAALASAIATLVSDPAGSARLGHAGRRIWARDYAIDAWVQRLEDLYLRLLDSH